MIAMIVPFISMAFVVILALLAVACWLYFKPRLAMKIKKSEYQLIDDLDGLSDDVNSRRYKKGEKITDRAHKNIETMNEGDKAVKNIRNSL